MSLSSAVTAFINAMIVVSVSLIVLIVLLIFIALIALKMALRAKRRGIQNLQGQHIRR